METETLSKAITDRYAWPGGYPMYLVMSDSMPICMDCAAKNEELILRATNDGYEDGWIVSYVEVNWEDSDLCCEHCGEKIESAYQNE